MLAVCQDCLLSPPGCSKQCLRCRVLKGFALWPPLHPHPVSPGLEDCFRPESRIIFRKNPKLGDECREARAALKICLNSERNESGHLCLHVAKVDHHTPNLFYIRLKQNQLVSKGCDEGVQQLDRGTESRHLLRSLLRGFLLHYPYITPIYPNILYSSFLLFHYP